jgi:hypothetical protein
MDSPFRGRAGEGGFQKVERKFANLIYPWLKPWVIENDITVGKIVKR